MKMHFSIPVSQQKLDTLGGRYVLYSVYLEGFLFCKVRYSQLHRWNEQLKRVFGNCLPPFPPKYYLAMTTSMADERRDQLEQYLQSVPMDPKILRSEVFIHFFTLLQQDTFKITTKKVFLDVFLPDGRNIRIEILTSDTAERVLEIVSYKTELSRELIGYFSLFLIQSHSDGALSVMKKMAEFELPYVSLQSTEVENCKVGLRKWYMDPSLDSMLMDCQTAVNLLYGQAVQEIEKNWAKPTPEQRQELEALRKAGNQTKFLELVQQVQHYGYMQLDTCTCDYPEPGCVATVSVGNNEISCYIKLPGNQTQEVNFKMSHIKSWQVTFLGSLLEEADGPQQTLNQNLELRFQYSEGCSWQCFTIYTKQAFLLSSCLKKMISEKLTKLAAENPEMIEDPLEQGKSKKSYRQQSQINYFDFPTRKSKIAVKSTEEDCVFETIREEDL
ncbi:sorting nexin-31 isoform X2 [Vombatus ursinus]|uniref:sorting nexin-31 isoform X2 n=1 Tax=Vombatus ursinus TaxID=29139 RepID=UPI000FFD2525|nr:sorting nexin-31 isoform X2 [Vombatus ursinus]